jgi:hypothetical protein
MHDISFETKNYKFIWHIMDKVLECNGTLAGVKNI